MARPKLPLLYIILALSVYLTIFVNRDLFQLDFVSGTSKIPHEGPTVLGGGQEEFVSAGPDIPIVGGPNSKPITKKRKVQQVMPHLLNSTTSNKRRGAPIFPLDVEAQSYPGFWESTEPWTNVTTCVFQIQSLIAGLKNQQMVVASVLMAAMTRYGCGQVLLSSARHKDTYGSEKPISHEALFDVPHFNSYYPQVPRFVRCDPEIHQDFNCDKSKFRDDVNSTTTIEISMQQNHAFGLYKRYSQLTGKGGLAEPGKRHPADLAILQGAERIHPWLLEIVESLLAKTFGIKDDNFNYDDDSKKKNIGDMYFTLHPRIEPDMMAHPLCRGKKFMNLTRIFEVLEQDFPNPPAPFLFIPVNRQYIEMKANPNDSRLKQYADDPNHILNIENLQTLNRAVTEGIYGGRVKAFEFGANVLKGTPYEERPSITGSLLNYHVALHGKVFVGTEISTYSTDVMATRFYRNRLENYKYLPEGAPLKGNKYGTDPSATRDGIFRWTDETTVQPQSFSC